MVGGTSALGLFLKYRRVAIVGLHLILAGKTLAPKPALKRGLVDELVPAEYLVEVAVRMLSRGKLQRPGHRLTNNSLVAAAIAARVRSQLLKRTRGHYPAVV